MKIASHSNSRTCGSAASVSRTPGVRESKSGKLHGMNLRVVARQFCRHFDTVFCATRPWLRESRLGEFRGRTEESL